MVESFDRRRTKERKLWWRGNGKESERGDKVARGKKIISQLNEIEKIGAKKGKRDTKRRISGSQSRERNMEPGKDAIVKSRTIGNEAIVIPG